MKTLVFSDTHLGKRVEECKLRFLRRLIARADRVVINGDFWDKYWTSFDEFMRSGWQTLFPLLKKRRTVYLYGNHDPKQLSDQRVSRFSVKQADGDELNVGRLKLKIEHGHRLEPAPWLLEWLIKLGYRLTHTYFVVRWLVFLQQVIIRVLRINFYKQITNYQNMRIKKQWTKESKGRILVCGHTHSSQNALSENYLNTGMIRYGAAQYLWIDDDKLKLVEECY